MTRELPGPRPALAWVFSAYLLAATVVIALYGRLADVLGRKPMLLVAIGPVPARLAGLRGGPGSAA